MGTQRNASAGIGVCELFTKRGNMFQLSRSFPCVFEQLEARLLQSVSALNLPAGAGVGAAVHQSTQHAPLGNNLVHSGDFDQTFGVGGKTVLDVFGPDSAQTVLVQSDGKILVAGASGVRGDEDPPMSTDVSVARLNTDGSLDASFGTNGIVMLQSRGWSAHDAAIPMLLTNDGHILVGGSGLSRLNSNGSLDSTFGVNGSTTSAAYFYSMALMGDGKVVASNGVSFTRFNTDGSLDTTFGTSGTMNLVAAGEQWVHPTDMVVQLDGKLLVLGDVRMAGMSHSDMMLTRLNADGSLDTNFGTSGQQLINLPANMTGDSVAVRLLDNGKFLVVGNGNFNDGHTSYNGTLLMRFKRTGALDQSFANTGVMLDHNLTDNQFGVAVQGDGKILVAGNGTNHVSLYRYNADGTRDATFGVNGHFQTNLQSNPMWCEAATGVALQADGGIVLLGQIELDAFSRQGDDANVFAACDFVVMRLTGDSGPLTVTDNGQDDPTPAPTPDPDPSPASPAHDDTKPSDSNDEGSTQPVTPTPHDDSSDNGDAVVTRFIAMQQTSPFRSQAPADHHSVGFELLSGVSDDQMLSDLL